MAIQKWVVALVAVVTLYACNDAAEQAERSKDEAYEKKSAIYQSYPKGAVGADGMYRSEDGDFLVRFPGEPEHSVDYVETQAGKVRMDMFVFNQSATQSFMVSISEFPSKHVKNEGPENLLKYAVAGSLKSLGETNVLDDRPFSVNGMPAKRLKASSEEWNVSAELFMVGNRLYQVTILRDGSLPDEAVEREYLKSFHILR